MKTPLAWRNLLHERVRTGVAVAGVAFAVILVLMQLGFFFTVERTATLMYDCLDFDIAVMSRDYLHAGKAGQVAVERLYPVQAVPGVRSAAPFWIGFGLWLNADPNIHQRRAMMILGVRPEDTVFTLPAINNHRDELKELHAVMVDARSRPEFGPHSPGTVTELGTTAVKVVGEYQMGTGFAADGDAIASESTYRAVNPMMGRNMMTMGLIRLEPGTDPDAAKARMLPLVPADTQIMTRRELLNYEERHWVVKTSVGIIFGLGVAVALIVGLAIVYQVLSSDIANRIPEYATLMAMGYGRRYISGVVIQQALMMALAGFIPGWIISFALFNIAAAGAHLPMKMTLGLTVAVLVLNIAMCTVSGLLSLRKVNTADPADLFV
jgi:putative ABC transport system permease protein